MKFLCLQRHHDAWQCTIEFVEFRGVSSWPCDYWRAHLPTASVSEGKPQLSDTITCQQPALATKKRREPSYVCVRTFGMTIFVLHLIHSPSGESFSCYEWRFPWMEAPIWMVYGKSYYDGWFRSSPTLGPPHFFGSLYRGATSFFHFHKSDLQACSFSGLPTCSIVRLK